MDYLPQELLERVKQIYSLEEQKNIKIAFETSKRNPTFRVNTLTSTISEIEASLWKHKLSFEKLDVPVGCYMIKEASEKDIWKLDIYKEGKIYMQGISSQLPVSFFDTEKPLKILDACAAPWGKTSQLSALYPDATIWAFEPQKSRFEKMKYNLEKLRCTNVETIQDGIENIKKYITSDEEFDLILVDAPCSSEWSISKYDEKFLSNWSLPHIKKNYKRQRGILDHVLPYLKVNGELVYTTCTLSPEENEAVVHYLLCNYKELELQNIDILENKYISIKEPLKSFGKYVFKKEISEKSLRILPNQYTEGFFIAKMKKCDFKV